MLRVTMSTVHGTPLARAAEKRDGASMRVLLAAGAGVDVAEPNNGWTPLARAAAAGYVEGVDMLLRAGAAPARVQVPNF